MPTEVKKKLMPHQIADLAKSYDVKPGHVFHVLNELSIEHDGVAFDADPETLSLVEEGAYQAGGDAS